ncbi:MAG: tRNA preQ1(34) S-adenosylmethionine ribosyltransferase-isomerase QueA [Planctomycetes bacterium]|nr:tRNA preQ1(34) S-adenosylmethionine ribosyltransferase-isomerase QueA [Planctomycetota bacterium]
MSLPGNNVLRTSDLNYDLPHAAIATRPAEPRDSARLMIVSRTDESLLEHARISDLPGFFNAGDAAVFNTTRVLPARWQGTREDTGGRVEGLYLRAAQGDEAALGERRWVCLVRVKHPRAGMRILAVREEQTTRLTLVAPAGSEPGAWIASVEPVAETDDATLSRIGFTPLPPYILAARKSGTEKVPDAYDRDRYQTVYARHQGSVAAPTAGLHFTPAILDRIDAAGVTRLSVVLHVGTGTFKPVETEYVEQHPMHSEWCSMGTVTAEAILAVRESGRRVFCIGTTAARTVETYATLPAPRPQSVATNLLITPGFQWRWTDALLTNFHLPQSTLLAMCASLFPGGIHRLKSLYKQALEADYRFFSYGDAMLILP